MKRFFSIILAIILACAGTFDTVLANEAAAPDELPEGTKSVTVSYDRAAAVAYAIKFAKVDHNGIFKSMGLDCTNFVVVGLRRHQRLFVGRHRRIEGAGRCKLSADIDLVRQECRLAVSVRKRCIYPGGRFLGLCNNQHRGRSAGNGIQ